MGAPGRGHPDPGEVAGSAESEQHAEEYGSGSGKDGHPPERWFPVGIRPRAQEGDGEHGGVIQSRRILGRVCQRQEYPRHDHPPRHLPTAPDAGGTPGCRGEEQQRRGVVGRVRAQVQCGRDRGEQRSGEEGGALIGEQPARRAPDERRHAEHADQGQQPRRGQPAEAACDGAGRRVNDRSTGEPGLIRRNRGAVQPVRPVELPCRQVERLITERGLVPQHASGKRRLHREHREQRPPGPQFPGHPHIPRVSGCRGPAWSS